MKYSEDIDVILISITPMLVIVCVTIIVLALSHSKTKSLTACVEGGYQYINGDCMKIRDKGGE